MKQRKLGVIEVEDEVLNVLWQLRKLMRAEDEPRHCCRPARLEGESKVAEELGDESSEDLRRLWQPVQKWIMPAIRVTTLISVVTVKMK